jgi:hypothetical protein
VSRVAPRLWGAACTLGAVIGCFSDRPRPAPPQLTIVLDKTVVRSPDTLTGTLRAEDPDGIDSVWLAIDVGLPPLVWDGRLGTAFSSPFRSPIAKGHGAGERIRLKLTARDVAGFTGERDTVVSVAP